MLRQLEESQKLGPKTLADAMEELQRAKARGEEDPENDLKFHGPARVTLGQFALTPVN